MFENAQQELYSFIQGDIQVWANYLRGMEENNRQSRITKEIVCRMAIEKARQEDGLEWTEIAIRAAKLNALEDGGRYRISARQMEMMIRARAIAKRGLISDHPILNLESIERLFFDELKFSPEVAREKSTYLRKNLSALKNLPAAEKKSISTEMSELRRIKQNLRPIKWLANSTQLPESSNLWKWLEIYDFLL